MSIPFCQNLVDSSIKTGFWDEDFLIRKSLLGGGSCCWKRSLAHYNCKSKTVLPTYHNYENYSLRKLSFKKTGVLFGLKIFWRKDFICPHRTQVFLKLLSRSGGRGSLVIALGWHTKVLPFSKRFEEANSSCLFFFQY